MQTYQSTPDYYRDYIEHGWLKDQAAKTHKYIKRWRNKAGKWVYQYKDTKTRKNRKKDGYMPEDVSYNVNSRFTRYLSRLGRGLGLNVANSMGYRGDSGRPKSTSRLDSGRIGARRISTTHIDLNNTRPKKKARITNAFNARQAQLAANRRKTQERVARLREWQAHNARMAEKQSDFEKEFARVKKKIGR